MALRTLSSFRSSGSWSAFGIRVPSRRIGPGYGDTGPPDLTEVLKVCP